MPEDDALEKFRGSLKDVTVILEKFSPLCRTPDELLGLVESALLNDGVLRLLMRELTPLSRR